MLARFGTRWALVGVLGIGFGCGAEVAIDPAGERDEPPSSTPPAGSPTADSGAGDDASGPPTVAITSPSDRASLATETFGVIGTSAGMAGVASVFVAIGPNAPRLAKSDDGYRSWSLDALAPPGTFTVSAIAYGNAGESSAPATITLDRPSSLSDALAPTVEITSPAAGTTPPEITVLVRGTAKDDRAVVRMEVRRNGELLDERAVATDDFFASWSRLVTLLPGRENQLEFSAFDALGNRGVASIRLLGRSQVDAYPPTVSIATPLAGATVNTDRLAVTGQAFDNLAIREVKVRSGIGGSFSDYVVAKTTDAFAHWSVDVPIAPGSLTLQARAIDVSGLASDAEIAIQNIFKPEWSAETLIPLRLNTPASSPLLRASLDKTGVNAVLNATIQKQTRLLTLDPGGLLTNALTTIKSACGTDWQNDKQYPAYDCNLTALGRTFRGPDGTWRSSPEFALVRLLTMTPANVLVDGTSIEQLKDLANLLGIGGGFNEILADSLGIGKTTTILTTPTLVETLRTRFLATHPYVAATAGSIPVSLYDAMNDMAPLGPALGPVPGVHPGVLDPTLSPNAVVLGPNFQMRLVGASNLRWLDGVVLASGKDYMAVVVDTTGPTYDDVLEFDFTDPARFDITGLTPSPTIDLRLKLFENGTFSKTCSNSATWSCVDNRDGMPVGTSFVWSTPRWQLENIIAYGAYTQYRARDNYRRCYSWLLIPCAASVEVGYGSAPGGWMHMATVAGLGSPPRDQYLWELLGEVAQVNLHRFTVSGQTTTLPEGQVNPAFTLSQIPIGLTAAQIRAQVGPALQAQRATLAQSLLGDYAKNNGNVDFYLRKGADGASYLYFAASADPRPTAAYTYTKPGFFSDATLATKVSAMTIAGSGDTTHEKLKLAPGERTIYAQDPAGKVYRLRVTTPAIAGADIEVRIARRML